MKRRRLFLIALFMAACVCGTVYFAIIPSATHRNIVDHSHDYQPVRINSYDGRYVLETYKIEDATGVYAAFTIKWNATQDEVFRDSEKYRTMDLKSISWIDNTLDIIVISGDVGSIAYEFVDGTWKT